VNVNSPTSKISSFIKAIWIVAAIIALPVLLGGGYLYYNRSAGAAIGIGNTSTTSSAASTATPFSVTLLNPRAKAKYQRTQFYFSSNAPLRDAEVPVGWKYYSAPDSTGTIAVIVETAKLKPGVHTQTLVFFNTAGERAEAVVEFTAVSELIQTTFWPVSKFYFEPDSLLALANKEYRLPMYYQAEDIVKLDDHGIKNYNSAQIREVALADLKLMTKAIAKAGIDYHVTSGYRSFGSQVSVYNYWLDLSKGDVAYTDSYSARPGHSEHQLGTTIDFLTKENGDNFYKFEDTALAKWLAANAHKYGFVKSYPKGKQDITGYKFEPWHYRFIGRENAAEFMATKLTLTEWLYEKNGLSEETL
jgi:D-alanyl-D-alanine carboxypeptidase